MKYEWKKEDKILYLPGKKPELVEVPTMKFFMISGKGNPNGELFGEHVGALYGPTYTIKMMPKKGPAPEGYHEYALFPLEGVWDFDGEWNDNQPLDKDSLTYTVMIRQPDFVTPELAAFAIESAQKKKNANPYLGQVTFGEITEGLSVQMTHVGPYDDEPASFAMMRQFMEENGLERVETAHREIYMGDPRRGKPENRKTVLRYRVKRKG